MSVKKRETPAGTPPAQGYDTAYQQYREERASNVVRKELARQVKGKPSRSMASESVLRSGWIGIMRTVKLVIALVLAAGFFLAGLGGGILAGYITTAEPVPAVQLRNTGSLTTHIYDAEGNIMAKVTGSQNIDREIISYDDIKDTYMVDAITAIEDERFFDHIGVDPKRIASAVLSAMVNQGSASHGGSTITQQTVKMITGRDEVSAQRKFQEWYKAINLERQYTKTEILQLYLNLMPMANSYVGIQSAAKAYFGKPASQLTLPECALLAGISKSPVYYNPRTEFGLRNALRRQRIVLQKMLELEKITEYQYQEALNTELQIMEEQTKSTATSINSYFVDYIFDVVTEDLMASMGYSRELAESVIYNNGLEIHTTMNPDIQAALDSTFNKEELFVRDPAVVANYPEHAQGGMVVIDQYTGEIQAMYGGYGRKTVNRGLNRATDIERQPGSSIKPIGVYGPAIDLGRISGATTIEDKVLYYNPDKPNSPYPINANRVYQGNLTVRTAVIESTNTIAMYVWKNIVTGENSLYYLKQLDIDRMSENYPAIALGGFNRGMSPLEMAGGYTALANNGLYTTPYAYRQVRDSDGNLLLDKTSPEYKQVFKPESAYIMTDLLVDTGTHVGRLYNEAGQRFPAAVKSGTTQENRDRWLVGYTPYYTAAVWYGYDNRLKTITVPSVDHNSPFDIWFDAMTQIHAQLPARDFERPQTITQVSVCRKTGMLPTDLCPSTVAEVFVEGSPLIPSETCTLHQPEPTPTPTPEPGEENGETEPGADAPGQGGDNPGQGGDNPGQGGDNPGQGNGNSNEENNEEEED